VNVGGTLANTTYADSDGVIRFSCSSWPAGVFTVVEDATYVPTESSFRGNAIGKSIYVNQSALSAANVTLYYSNRTAYGQTVISLSNGSFQFKNVSVGSYYVVIEKHLFAQNQSSVFNVNANMNTDIGSISLGFLDVNGDNKIDVLDLDMIGQNFEVEQDGIIIVFGIINCPRCDINEDGHVNVFDENLMGKNI
jgi:hypothetical protein